MTELLETILLDAFGDSSPCVLRYTDLPNVEKIWSFVEGHEALPHSDVVLIYDGQGDLTNQPFRPENWLTPWDWAIAVGILSARRDVISSHGLRCWIVDLLPPYWGAAGRARFKTVGALIPWVRWYRPVKDPRQLAYSTARLFEDIARRSELPSLTTAISSPDSIALTRAWTTLMSAPTDRHAIGNVIGPITLKNGLLRKYGEAVAVKHDSAQQRLQSLIEALGLVGHSDEATTAQMSAPETTALTNLRAAICDFPSFKVLLVDDQYEYGYHSVLSHVVLGADHESVNIPGAAESRMRQQSHIRVVSLSNPSALLQGLREAIADQPDWSRPRVLSREYFDVLCLDLRLFPDSTLEEPSKTEQGFLNELLQFCAETKTPTDNDKALALAMEAATRRARGGVEELHALCLLPLVINRVDPSLPIVLFSSTHQREIVDLFRDVRSIITTFSKPIVTGHASADVAIRSADDLIEALRNAVRIRARRGVWVALHELGRTIGESVQIREHNLRSRDNGAGTTYTITADTVRLLSSEFQRLFPDGRFADALQLPDNIMEQVGAKFDTPSAIGQNLNVFALYRVKGSSSWDDGVRTAYRQTVESRVLARNVLKHALSKMACDAVLKDAVKAIADHIGRNDPDFEPERFTQLASPSARKEITARYGSFSGLVADALDEMLRTEQKRLPRLSNHAAAIAAYQFYSVLAAMRNGRSHFRIRPGVREDELETAAGWLWMFFIEGLTILARGARAVIPGRLNDTAQLSAAATAQWLPNARFVDASIGQAYCNGVISRLGHLLDMGILRVADKLAEQGEYAKYLAAADARAPVPALPVPVLGASRGRSTPSTVHHKAPPTNTKQAIVRTRNSSKATYRPFEEKLRGFNA